MRYSSRSLRLVLMCVLGIPTSAMSATLQVASTGVDGPACGAIDPCRSIGRAVANAAAGDKIVVGPGYYSDNVDGDSMPNEPGEEPAGGIMIDKPLQLVSELGASSTLVRSRGPVFFIQASDVVFGKLGSGFTIATSGNPLLVGGSSRLVNVRVGGNVIVIDSDPLGPAAVIAAGSTRGRFENNRIVAPTGCSAGFFMASDSEDLIARNVVMGCKDGFVLQSTQGARFVRNTVIGNSGTGFLLSGTIDEFTGNVAIANGTGMSLDTPIPRFSGNTFAGNTSNCGVRNRTGTTLTATGNYWGAPTGPGPDPADDVCGDGPVVTVPFLINDPTQPQAALR